MSVTNAGKYRHLIRFYQDTVTYDDHDFPVRTPEAVYGCHAEVKTTRGMTLIANDSDFEKAFTRFVIRKPRNVVLTRDMRIVFRDRTYSIEYMDNVNESDEEIEIQAKELDQERNGAN